MKNKGFTLLELVVVTSIVALLSLISTAQFVKYRRTVRLAAVKNTLINMRTIGADMEVSPPADASAFYGAVEGHCNYVYSNGSMAVSNIDMGTLCEKYSDQVKVAITSIQSSDTSYGEVVIQFFGGNLGVVFVTLKDEKKIYSCEWDGVVTSRLNMNCIMSNSQKGYSD